MVTRQCEGVRRGPHQHWGWLRQRVERGDRGEVLGDRLPGDGEAVAVEEPVVE